MSDLRERQTELDETRYFLPTDESPPLDQEGFLRDEIVEGWVGDGRAFRLADLLKQRSVVVLGIPYVGKSFALREVRRWFINSERADALLFRDCRRPQAEWIAEETARFADLTKGQDALTWCVDSIDEGQEIGQAPDLGVIERIERTDKKARERLQLLATCRENDFPNLFESELRRLLGDCLVVRIAPLGRKATRALVGGKFEHVCDLIRTHGLREVAAQPAVLQSLSEIADTTSLTKARLWRGLIEQILIKTDVEQKTADTVREQFEAACRMSFVLTFGDAAEIDRTQNSVFNRGPIVGQLFGDAKGETLAGARKALRSGLFRRTSTGFSVAHRHLREWMTAFQLAALAQRGSADQVRELLRSGHSSVPSFFVDLAVATRDCLSDLVNDDDLDDDDGLDDWIDVQIGAFAVGLTENLIAAVKDAPSTVHSAMAPDLEFLPDSRHLRLKLSEIAKHWNNLKGAQRSAFFTIAQATRAKEFLDLAYNASLDRNEDADVRGRAVDLILAIGSTQQIESLAILTSEGTPVGANLSAKALSASLKNRKVSAAKVLTQLPKLNSTIDYTHVLRYEVAERMTLADAVSVITTPESYGDKAADNQIWDAAIRLVSNADALNDDVLAALTATLRRLAEKKDFLASHDIEGLLRTRSDFRKFFYLQTVPDTDSTMPAAWSSLSVTATDAPWLIDLLRRVEPANRRIFNDAMKASSALGEAGKKYVEELEAEFPKEAAQWKVGLEKFREEERRWQREFKKPPDVPIEQAVAQILAREDRKRVFHDLAWVCLDGPNRPNNITGSFEQLPSPTKGEVLAEFERHLLHEKRTKIPDGSSFSSWTMYEADAFERVTKAKGRDWLSESLVREWLPTVLRVAGDAGNLLELIADALPIPTCDVFLEFVRRELAQSESHAFTASRAPPGLWKEGFSTGLADLIRDYKGADTARGENLLELASHDPDLAIQLARHWLTFEDAPQARTTAAVRVLLAALPEEGMTALERWTQTSGLQRLLSIASAFGHFGRARVAYADWPVNLRERLVNVLYKFFPEKDDPKHPASDAYWVTPTDEVVEVRNRITWSFINTDTVESKEVLDRLSKIAPWVVGVLEQQSAERKVRALIEDANTVRDTHEPSESGSGGSTAPPGEPPREGGSGDTQPPLRRLPWRMLVRVLDVPDYRLALTSDDLQRALVQVLRRIGSTIALDYALLYQQPKQWKKRVDEDGLQAYLRVRLDDLLPSSVVDREAWAPLNKRSDLRVMGMRPLSASVHHKNLGRPSTVQIEIKWSDNRDLPDAITKQLGPQYLVRQNCSRGILVVAWCGEAYKAGLGPKEITEAARADATKFESENPSCNIKVVLLDAAVPSEIISASATPRQPKEKVTARREKPPKERTFRKRR